MNILTKASFVETLENKLQTKEGINAIQSHQYGKLALGAFVVNAITGFCLAKGIPHPLHRIPAQDLNTQLYVATIIAGTVGGAAIGGNLGLKISTDYLNDPENETEKKITKVKEVTKYTSICGTLGAISGLGTAALLGYLGHTVGYGLGLIGEKF